MGLTGYFERNREKWKRSITKRIDRVIIPREIKRRSTLQVTEINALSGDIPLLTKEIFTPNDFYGHATNLKKYANLPNRYPIKASIEHGPYFSDYVWEEDVKARLPAVFCFGRNRIPALRKVTGKPIFPLGPLLFYATHHLDEGGRNAEKKRLGRNLLVFPFHSTHWIDANYDLDSLCRNIGEIGKPFDSIRVCLYWKEVLRGHAEVYRRHGFECVTAGHIYDPLFLARLKSIIDVATSTVSNGLGTHIGYCVMMNKPHHLINDKYTFSANQQYLEDATRRNDMYISDPDVQRIIRAFGELRGDISQEQMDLVDRFWGLSERKTAKEMEGILALVEDLYRKESPWRS